MNIEIHKKAYALVAVCLYFVLSCRHGYAQDFKSQFERIQQFEQQGLLTNAVDACSDLLRQEWSYKERGTLLIERGNLRLKLKLYIEAEPDVKEAMRLLPPNPNLYKIQGNVLAGLGLYQESLASFAKAIQQAPKDDVLLANRAFVCLQFGFAAAAISDCSMAIDLNPNRISAYSLRAQGYMQQVNYALAAEDLKKVIELSKPNPASYMDYAKCLYSLGETNESLGFITKAAELRVADPGLQKCILASFFSELGDIKQALMFADQVAELEPKNGVVLVSRGALLMLMNDLDGAAVEIETGIQSWPQGSASDSALIDQDEAYRQQGLLHLVQGKYVSAKLDFDKAMEFNPDKSANYGLTGLSALAAILNGERALPLQITQRGVARNPGKAELACLFILCGGSLSKNMSDDLSQYSAELWPYPIVQYYLGHMSAAEVVTRAERSGIDGGEEQVCEACFYIGAKLLVDHQPEMARQYFVRAAEYGTLYWPYRQLARKQLKENCFAPLIRASESDGLSSRN